MFDGSEADFLRYLRLAAAGARPSSRDVQNPVSVRLADETDYKHQGRMDFVDNVAQSEDRHHPRPRHLRQQGRPADARASSDGCGCSAASTTRCWCPTARSRPTRRSKIVFTVADDGTVGTKRVELGPIVDGLRVIRSGLAPTDRIVIEGLQRARPGQKVKAEDGKIEAAAQ